MAKWIICLALYFCLFVTVGVRIVARIRFDQDCGGYLKRAADANTVELATQELQKAIEYLEREDLRAGYTSVLWKTPDEDLGFFYTNIKASHLELVSLPENATTLEKSNALMKLRETLLDSGEKGVHLTVPQGISIYPYNAIWGICMWLFGIAAIVQTAVALALAGCDW